MTNTVVVDQRFENTPAKVVWKFIVELKASPQQIRVPSGARLVHSEFIDQPGARVFWIWYEVDLKNQEVWVNHVFQVWGTGDPTIPKVAKHVHSGMSWIGGNPVQNPTKVPEFVWHLYEFPTGAKVVDI